MAKCERAANCPLALFSRAVMLDVAHQMNLLDKSSPLVVEAVPPEVAQQALSNEAALQRHLDSLDQVSAALEPCDACPFPGRVAEHIIRPKRGR